MATIEKRGNAYRITVSAGYDACGNQIRKKMTWKPEPDMTKKQIEKELERQKVLFEESVKNGKLSNRNVKFEVLAKEWIHQAEIEGNLKQLSLDRLKSCQARTYAAIGHLYVDKITTRQIQSFINNLAEDGINQQTGGGLSTKSQKHYLNFMSNVFRYAIKCGIITDNPCRNVNTIKFETAERVIYSVEEAQRFIDALNKHAPKKYRMFFLLAICCGFRRGEILGFEWKDINFETGVISVNRTSLYSTEKGVFTDTPKTRNSLRSLKLPDVLLQELKAYRIEQTQERLKTGDKWHDSDRLFTKWNGEPMMPNTVGHWLSKFCKKHSLPVVNVHSMRHFFATNEILSGEDIKTVSSILGHSQTSTTLNIYAHTFRETQARAMETITTILDIKNNA